MTKRLFDEDAYLRSFTAKVESCMKCPGEDGDAVRYFVTLDATAFFPEEGGQTPDTGLLGGFRVVDVQIKDDVITHTIEVSEAAPLAQVDASAGGAVPFKAGDAVTGEIDWDKRYSNMQQHTGEHVFSGLVHSRFGYDNVGFHLSDSVVTMDYSGPITSEEIRELEREANEVIVRQIPVETGYPDETTLRSLDYRCKKELKGAIRIVTIPGVDTCACCAPHLHNTGEIGLLKVTDVQNYKGGVRVFILCGFRALEDYRMSIDALREISHATSAPLFETPEAVTRLKDELERAKYATGEAVRRLLSLQISMLDSNETGPIIFTEGADTTSIREAVNTMTGQHKGYCGIFNGNDEAGYSFIIGSRDSDCNIIAKKLREKLDAKCGGKSAMIQGQVAAPREEITGLIRLQDCNK